MKQLYALLIFILLFPSLESIAQNEIKYERTISINQFIKELTSPQSDSVVELSKINIVADTISDKRYIIGAGAYGRNMNWDSLITQYPIIEVENNVYLFKIRFGQRTVLPNIHFKKKVHIEGVDVYGDLDFRKCQFEKSVYMLRPEAYFLGFYDCIFNKEANFEEANPIQFVIKKCIFNRNFWLYNVEKPLQLNIYGSHFKGNSYIYSNNPSNLNISDSQFDKVKNTNSLNFSNTAFKNLGLTNVSFKLPVHFSGTSIKESFNIVKCQFNQTNDFSSISLPEGNTYARWSVFEKFKFGIILNDSTYYNGKNAIDSTTQDEYYALIKVYSQFLRAYKNNGDQESYNDCYIEMKDIQTRKAAFNFKQDPSVNNYFEWKLNRFLKIFCDYGTNPVKALIVSTYVIMLFGLLYFVFPSEGEVIDWKRLSMALKNRKKMMPLIKKELFIGFKQLANALALSMNAFVTLGYGEMPARGIARYLAVFEGLTGWFLLSIFSASLISQILQ
jgi:hypothetical protein